MKGFFASLIILALVFVIVGFNMLYVKNTLQALKKLSLTILQADEISSDTKLSELKQYWEKHSKFLALSANFNLIDKINDELIRLEWAISYRDEKAVMQSVLILLDSFDDLERYERLSLSSVL